MQKPKIPEVLKDIPEDLRKALLIRKPIEAYCPDFLKILEEHCISLKKQSICPHKDEEHTGIHKMCKKQKYACCCQKCRKESPSSFDYVDDLLWHEDDCIDCSTKKCKCGKKIYEFLGLLF